MARFAFLLALALFVSAPAWAMQCMGTQYLARALHNQGERIKWRGISEGNLVMLWVNPLTTKWSVVVTNPAAIGCIIAFGTDGEMVTRVKNTAPPRNDR
jgi:hypothetical protein